MQCCVQLLMFKPKPQPIKVLVTLCIAVCLPRCCRDTERDRKLAKHLISLFWREVPANTTPVSARPAAGPDLVRRQ
jgi:hypothetical protein